MEYSVLQGKEILPYLVDIAQLRIEIFREWPYLYEGNLEYEKKYLEMYSDTDASILILAREKETIVGAAIGLPVDGALHEIKELFAAHNVSTKEAYYFAEALLLPHFRGCGYGKQLIAQFEKQVRALGVYSALYGFEVVRDLNDLRRPADYASLDAFWEKGGYALIPDWETSFSWCDVGDCKESDHPMRFRKKNL